MIFPKTISCVTNFFSLCIILVDVSLSWNGNTSPVKCSTQYKPSKQIDNFRFDCSVTFPTETARHLTYNVCKINDHRSLVVKAYALLENGLSFICSSNNAITVDVKFPDGIAMRTYLNMTWGRKVVDFYDKATYTYYLQIFPCELSQHRLGAAAKYIFSSVQFPSETIDVLWFTSYGFADTSLGHLLNFVYWMEDKRDIELTRDSIYIPCVSPFPITIRKITTNSTVFNYNSTSFGLFLSAIENPSELLGEYICVNPEFINSSLRFNIVSPNLSHVASHSVYSINNNTLRTKFAFFEEEEEPLSRHTSLDIDGLNFELKCQAKNPHIAYIVPQRSLVNSDEIRCNSTYSTTFDSVSKQTFTTAVCVTSDLEGHDKEGVYTCFDGEQRNVLKNWYLKHGPTNKIKYDIDKHEMRCYFPGAYGNGVHFLQDTCYNPLTCKLMQKGLHKNNYGNHISTHCDPNYDARHSQCATLKIVQKALYVCSNFQENPELSYSYSNIYLVGFDDIVYHSIESKPPKNAILKLANLKQMEQIMINNCPVKYIFYCEAHSFFFEEGIQWLFQYANGTTHLVPKDLISNIVGHSSKKFEEYPNPYSNVNILVADKKVGRIVCAAPRLSILDMNNYREWEYVGMNISVFDAIAPKFVETESKFWFTIGEKNKEIKCQAIGLPKPEIHWKVMSGQNASTYEVIDLFLYSVLKFPTYVSANEGEYICTATNEVGNVSKTILVRSSSPVSWTVEKLALLLAGIILMLILTFGITFYWYTRKMKMIQSLEMTNILQLLNGKPANFEDGSASNTLQTPYDRKWELEKYSFCIDKNKILGSGEFGIVYKGTIAKLNIDVAFKSLKPQGNMGHLKSLVAELKLLIYIDKHSNIVELFGAYTQEIKKGIIYVAIEFCALGSLESHLCSNKGTFQKCPVLTSYFEELETPREGHFVLCKSTNYSIKSLLKWCNEISQAMDYLYSKKVVHGDLATRNILLTADWTAKLTDFGLSKKLYKSDEYVKKGHDPLLWRWLALESLISNVFNVKTDVWAFGITMWEIFSLGDTPYPGVYPNMKGPLLI